MIRIPLLVASALLLVPAALAQDLSEADRAINNTVALGEPADAPTQWLGAEPHFVMAGELGDYVFAINVPAPQAAGVALTGKREYGPDGEGLAFIDFEVAIDAVIGGIERSIEMEFENADFSGYELPADFALQGEEFPGGSLSNFELEFEWEWVEKSVVVNEEVLFTDGTLTLALDEGEADERGYSDNGVIGGFVSATRNGQTIAVSFTAPVTEAEIDD